MANRNAQNDRKFLDRIKLLFHELQGELKIIEEIRLAFSLPSYKSLTRMLLDTQEFNEFIKYLIREEILMMSIQYFIRAEKEAFFNELQDQLDKEYKNEITTCVINISMAYLAEIKVLNKIQMIIDILDENIRRTNNLINFYDKKIELLTLIKIQAQDNIDRKYDKIHGIIQIELSDTKYNDTYQLILPRTPKSDTSLKDTNQAANDSEIIISDADIKKKLGKIFKEKIASQETDLRINPVEFVRELVTASCIECYHKKGLSHKEIEHLVTQTINSNPSQINQLNARLNQMQANIHNNTNPDMQDIIQNKKIVHRTSLEIEKTENKKSIALQHRDGLINSKNAYIALQDEIKNTPLIERKLENLLANAEQSLEVVENRLPNFPEENIETQQDDMSSMIELLRNENIRSTDPSFESQLDLSGMLDSLDADVEISDVIQEENATPIVTMNGEQKADTKFILQRLNVNHTNVETLKESHDQPLSRHDKDESLHKDKNKSPSNDKLDIDIDKELKEDNKNIVRHK